MAKPRLLWLGDSPTAPTGFARVTENVLARLRPDWAVGVIGINYSGDPHKLPYPIYPAHLGGDMYGRGRFEEIVKGVLPAVVLILNDPWIVASFLDVETDVPIVAYMPVDAPNQPPEAMALLNKLKLSVFYTQFGLDEARKAGYTGPAEIVPHGVDSQLYRPIDRAEALAALGLDEKLPDDVFIVGNVNRNQQRKRLDLTMMLFARWVEQHEIPDNVRLLLHCARRDIGWDLVSLARYLGIKERLIFSNPAETSMSGLPEDVMPYVYNAIDVQVSTTMGEGWGLTTHEGMACGTPQLVPDWAALGEWPRGAVRYARVGSTLAHENMLTTLGGIVEPDAFIRELDALYRNKDLREQYGRLALARATEPRFAWDAVAARFDTLLRAAAKKEPASDREAVAV
jgi:glycosyltransferase involved in cell wall biosynthesis